LDLYAKNGLVLRAKDEHPCDGDYASHDHSITAMYVMLSKIFEKSRPTEKLGEQDVLLAPPITLLGEQLLPLFPRL